MALPNKEDYPTLQFLGTDGRLSDALTVPGTTDNLSWGRKTVVSNQTSSILGWTCGNMVGRTLDVAQFFFDLLGPSSNPVVSEASKEFMCEFAPVTAGWGKEIGMWYGAGLMAEKVADDSSDFDYFMGHAGETYGFSSSQGFIPRVNGSFSVVANVDDSMIPDYAVCRIIEQLAGANLGCWLTGEAVV
jgi:hypothetical protein